MAIVVVLLIFSIIWAYVDMGKEREGEGKGKRAAF